MNEFVLFSTDAIMLGHLVPGLGPFVIMVIEALAPVWALAL